MAKMTVYHGGFMPVEHPEIRIGRNTKDFGTGFYCTIIKEQNPRADSVGFGDFGLSPVRRWHVLGIVVEWK